MSVVIMMLHFLRNSQVIPIVCDSCTTKSHFYSMFKVFKCDKNCKSKCLILDTTVLPLLCKSYYQSQRLHVLQTLTTAMDSHNHSAKLEQIAEAGDVKDVSQEESSTARRTQEAVSTSKVTSEASPSVGQKVMSKKALRRQERSQKYKELKKQRKAENLILTRREEAGYNLEDFDKTTYYFENGLRKIYPYQYVFATYAKGRWVRRTLKDVLGTEFGYDQPDDLSKSFEAGKIHVNNSRVSSNYIIKDCDYISHQTHRHENPVTDAALDIIEDNDEVIVVNKPSSIPCHPCGRYRFNSIVFILGKEFGYTNLRNIYRLDRLTSGVLILGKTAKTTKLLEDQILNREVQKEYVCRVEGKFPSEELTVDQPLQALSNKLRLQIVTDKGKPSQTTFQRLSFNGTSSVVKCTPHTGRTHQIRVHLQYLGYPIINDVFYNSFAWGPDKGKGAKYTVPFEKVCQRILDLHQATQWDGGENPLYHLKLQENHKQAEEGSNNDVVDNTINTQILQHCDNAMYGDVNVYEPPLKQRKTEEGASGIQTAPKSFFLSNCSNSDGCISLPSGASPSVCQKDEQSNKKHCSHSSTSKSLLSVCGTGSQDLRAKFDAALWKVDLSCALCKRTTIDPKPKDLVMFLHALKYKGPGWRYETHLPFWALEAWNDEESYCLDSATFQDD